MDINNISISDKKLRDAIYKAFKGKCFYTGQHVSKDDMSIDHVVPKSRGGKDSIYNYVLTSRKLNLTKRAKVDLSRVAPVLYIIKLVFAPEVIKRLYTKSRKRKGISGRKFFNDFLWGLLYERLQEVGNHSNEQAAIMVDAGRYIFGKGDMPSYKDAMDALNRDSTTINWINWD